MYNYISIIEEKLSSKDYTIENLLEEDEMFIHDLKNGNPKLLEL